MKKFLIAGCFLSCAFVYGITREDIVKESKNFDFGFFSAQEYAKDMCQMSPNHEKSKMEKLYNEKYDTLKEDTLNQSFFNVIRIINLCQELNTHEELNCPFSLKKRKAISKAWHDPDNYKTENLSKLNGLMFLSCLRKRVFAVSDKDNGDCLLKNITDRVLKELTNVFRDEDIRNTVGTINFGNKVQNNLKPHLNAIEEVIKNPSNAKIFFNENKRPEKKIQKAFRNLALLVINDMYWYFKNFEITSLNEKINRAKEYLEKLAPKKENTKDVTIDIDIKTVGLDKAEKLMKQSENLCSWFKKTTDGMKNIIKKKEAKKPKNVEEIESLNILIAGLESNIENHKAKIKEHEDSIKTAKSTIQNSEESIKNHEEEIRRHEDSIKDAEKTIKECKQTLNSKYSIENLEETIKQYNCTLKVYENELAYYQKIADILRAKIDESTKTTQGTKDLNKKNKQDGTSATNTKQTDTNFKPAGLTNIGNTCYFNAAMQALCASQKFREFVRENSNKSKLAENLHNLFTKMAGTKSALNEQTMQIFFSNINGLAETGFKVKVQQDAIELIQRILSRLSDDSVKTGINDLWKTVLTKEEIGSPQNKRQESNSTFTVVLEDKKYEISLEELIKKQLETEQKGNRDNETWHVGFTKLPPMLCISLARVGCSGSNRIYKLTTPVSYPKKLSLHEVSLKNGTYAETNVNYNLVAIINHQGDHKGGHYFAFVKGQGDTWYKQNDEWSTDTAPKFNNSRIKDPEGEATVFIYERVN